MRLNDWARVIVLVLVAPSVTIFAQTFKAGAGQSEIKTSPSMFPVPDPVTEYAAQHDPASIRVLILDDGTLRIALLTVDTPSIQPTLVDGWKAILTRVTGVKTENALVICDHNVVTPHITATGVLTIAAGEHGMAPGSPTAAVLVPRKVTEAQAANAKAYAMAVDDAIEAASTKALAALQPVRVGFGLGSSQISYSPQNTTDQSLALIRFNSLAGKPVAWLMDYALAPSVMSSSKTASGGALITGDFAAVAQRYLETHSGSNDGSGATAMYLMGAAGGQQPIFTAVRSVYGNDGKASRVDIHEAGYTLVDLIGERLGSDAVRVNETIKDSPTAPKLRLLRKSVEVGTQAFQQSNGAAAVAATPTGQKVAIPYVLLQIGDIVMVGTMHELNLNTGIKVRSDSPFPHTIVVTMVDGSNGGLSEISAYDHKSSAALNSYYVRGSAEAVAAAIGNDLRQLNKAR
jgi:hypothetical protein